MSRKAKKGEAIKWLNEICSSPGESCIFWPFRPNSTLGYARVSRRMAHLVAWEIYNQKPFPEDLEGRHTCNNGREGCVNPLHVLPGSRKQNMTDLALSGKLKGEKHHNSKLTEANACELIELDKQGFTRLELSQRFQISTVQVSRILTGKRWSHLTKLER